MDLAPSPAGMAATRCVCRSATVHIINSYISQEPHKEVLTGMD